MNALPASTLMEPAIAGFLLGAGLIIAIGSQNAFVLRLGIQKTHVLPVVLICATADAVLIAAGVGGFGTLVQQSPVLISAVTIIGAIFLTIYGFMAFRRALSPEKMKTADKQAISATSAMLTVLGLTFLNPHVYLDTVVLLGGLSAQYQGAGRLAYGTGAVIASFTWFFALGYGARLLTPWFEKPKSWQILDFSIAAVMWTLATKLVWSML